MTVVSVELEIEAPAEAVWAHISDPKNLPHWDKHIETVEGMPATGLDEGVTYSTVMRFMSVRARIGAEVLAWEPPQRCVIALSGLLDAVVTSTVEPITSELTLLEHDVDYHFRGGFLADLAARSLRLMGGPQMALRHGTLAQKHAIELAARR